VPQGVEQQNRQQECSSFIVLQLWQNIEFSGNPENKCAEYEVDCEDVQSRWFLIILVVGLERAHSNS
jgi:hypothetical protein